MPRPAFLLLLLVILFSKNAKSDSRSDSLSSVLRDVTGQLERFNSIYISKFERELSSTSSRLSSMESTLRSVADRALAWDNIQNHMTVWTDQTRTMERKLDMLNRCHQKQESWESKLSAVDALNHKLTALDRKINAMTRLEFKVEKVSEKLEEIDSKLNALRDRSTFSVNSDRSEISQFAKRGLFSYLTTVDAKLDNITRKMEQNTLLNPTYNTNRHPKVYGSRHHHRAQWATAPEPELRLHNGGKSISECFLSLPDSQILEDMNGKVDLLYDRITDPDYELNNFVGNIKRQAPSHVNHNSRTHSSNSNSHDHDNSSDFESTPEHIFARFWKSIFSPIKKMNRRFRSFETQLNNVERHCNGSDTPSIIPNIGEILDERIEPLDAVLREEMAETRVAVSDQAAHLEKLAQTMSNAAYTNEKLQAEITQRFDAQRAVMQSRLQELRSLILQYCNKEYSPPYIPPPTPPTTTLTTTPTTTTTTTRRPPLTSASRPYLPVQPTYGVATERSKRPAYVVRQSSNIRATRCIPKDSPLWQIPSLASSLPACPHQDGVRNSQRYAYRVHYNKQSKRNSRNRNSIIRSSSKMKRISKREINHVTDEMDTVVLGKTFTKNSLPMSFLDLDCAELAYEGEPSGVFQFRNERSLKDDRINFHTRFCDQDTDGGGWTVIQRRGSFGPPYLNFTRPWNEYKNGFGSLEREFWWGNDFIHKLTEKEDMTIRFDLWDFDGKRAFAEYLAFRIDNETSNYALHVSGYRGNASDSFSTHNGYQFSTFDRTNDEAPECCPCAPAYGGGWWFYSCFESNLNGEYYTNPINNDYFRGLIWELWLGDYSLKATEIKIRPQSFAGTEVFPTPFSDSSGGGFDYGENELP